MKSRTLDQFLESIIRVSAGRGHLGGASAGIFGYSRVDQSLRDSALAFATEYRSKNANQVRLKALADELEGQLHSAVVTGVISQDELRVFLDELHGFTDSVKL